MTSEKPDIDKIRIKLIVQQSCLNFGAVETARKLQEQPEKLQILLQLLIDEDLVDSSYLLGRRFLSEEDFAAFAEREEFSAVDKENLKVSQVTGALHEKLTGESLVETRKRLRKEWRAKAKAKKAAAREERAKNGESGESAPKGKKGKKAPAAKAGKPPKEAPKESKDGVPYLAIAEFGFKRENFFFVPTGRSFLKVRDHFKSQSVIGVDAEYDRGKLSTVTLASEEMIAVLDMISLRKNKEVSEYLVEILQSEDIEKVAHTFRLDAYYLGEALSIEPESIKKVLDLTDNIKEGESDDRIGLRDMVQKFFPGKTINQYYKKKNWKTRPLPQEFIDYAGLNGFIVLKIFLEHDNSGEAGETKYYTYEAPQNLPNFEEKPRRARKPRARGEGNKNATDKKPTQKRRGRGRGGRKPQAEKTPASENPAPAKPTPGGKAGGA